MAETPFDKWLRERGGKPSVQVVPDERGAGRLLSPQDRGDPIMDSLLAPADPSTMISNARETDPDPLSATEKRRASEATGLPPAATDAAKDILRTREEQELLRTAPITAAFYLDPANAAEAHDSVSDLSAAENLVAGIGERFFGLVGGFTRVTGQIHDDVSDFIERVLPLGVIEFDITGTGPAVSWRPSTEEEIAAESVLLPFARDFETVDLGYRPMYTWEMVKESPLAYFLPFAIEQGLVSVPDMLAVIANLPAYVLGRTGELGQTRAVHEGRIDATVEDFFKAAPAALSSAMLERLGARGFLGIGSAALKGTGAKAVAGAVGKAALLEAGTEATQEFLESLGETLGTRRGFDLAETLDRMAAGAVGGLGFGGTVRVGTATYQNYANARNQRGLTDRINALLVQSALYERAPEITAAHMEKVFEASGVTQIFMSVEELTEYANKLENPAEFYDRLGVSDQMEDAVSSNSDVEVTVAAATEVILGSEEHYEALADHMRFTEDGMTPGEAKELVKSVQEADALATAEQKAAERAGKVAVKFIAAERKGRVRQIDQQLADLDRQIDEVSAKIEGRELGAGAFATAAERAAAGPEVGLATTALNKRLQGLLASHDTLSQQQADILQPPTVEGRAIDKTLAAENEVLNLNLEKLLDEKTSLDDSLDRAKNAGDAKKVARVNRQRTKKNKEIQAARDAIAVNEAKFKEAKGEDILLRAKDLKRLAITMTSEIIRSVRAGFRAGAKATKADIKATQKDMVKIIKKSGLPAKDKAKFLSAVTTLTGENLPAVQARIMRLMQKEQARQLRTAILKRLKKFKPLKEASPELNSQLADLKEVAKTKKADAAELLDASQEQDKGSLSEKAILENRILALIAGKETNPAALEDLLLSIDEVMDINKSIRAENVFNRQGEVIATRDRLKAAVGEEAEPPSKVKAFFREAEALIFLGPSGSWRNKLQRIISTENKAEADSVMDDLGLFEESRVHEQNKIDVVAWFEELAQEALGLDTTQLLDQFQKDMREQVNLGKFTHAAKLDDKGNIVEGGKSKSIVMTRAELRKRAMELRDPTVRELLMHPDSNAYTEEIIDAINNELTPTDEKLIDVQLQFYDEYYHRINAAYEEAYGVSLPKIENYSPIRPEWASEETGEFLRSILYRGGVTAGAFKGRKQHVRKLLPKNDMEVLQNHIAEMEYFIAYNKKVRLLNDVFHGKGGEIMGLIRANNGDAMARTILRDLEYFAKKGTMVAITGEQIFVTLLRNYSFAQLALKPQIGLKQIASFSAMAEDVSVIDFIDGMIDFASNPKAALDFLNRSDFYRNRGINIDQDFADMTTTQFGGNLLNYLGRNPSLVKILMLPIRVGDRGAIAIGGYAHVRAKMKAGMSEVDALASFGRLASRTQQSPDPDQQSELQRGSAFGRIMSQFMSSANALTRAEYSAIVEKGKGRISNAEFTKRMVVLHILIPNLIQLIANGFRWDKEDQIFASLFGAFNGIFIVGDLIEATLNYAFDRPTFGTATRHPLSFFDDLLKSLKSFEKDGLSWEDFIEGSRAIDRMSRFGGALTGIPITTLYNDMRGIAQLVEGDAAEGGALLLLGYSPYVIEKQEIGK